MPCRFLPRQVEPHIDCCGTVCYDVFDFGPTGWWVIDKLAERCPHSPSTSTVRAKVPPKCSIRFQNPVPVLNQEALKIKVFGLLNVQGVMIV